MEYKVLNPVSYTTDITTEIIKICEESLHSDPEYMELNKDGINFHSIIPYGSSENPYFLAKTVFKFIGISGDKYHIKNNLIADIHYIKAKINYNKKDPVNMLSRQGLMKVMYIGKTKLSETFQRYIFDLLDVMWKKNKDMIISELNVITKELETEKLKRKELQLKVDESRFLYEAFADEENHGIEDHKELTILRRKYFKPYYIYVMNWDNIHEKCNKQLTTPIVKTKMRKKKSNEYEGINLSDTDEETKSNKEIELIPTANIKKDNQSITQFMSTLVDQYDINDIDIKYLKENENEYFYIKITSKKITKPEADFDSDPAYKFIDVIYLKDACHYNEMKQFINENNKEYITGAKYYQLSYAELLNARSRTFIEKNKHILLNI